MYRQKRNWHFLKNKQQKHILVKLSGDSYLLLEAHNIYSKLFLFFINITSFVKNIVITRRNIVNNNFKLMPEQRNIVLNILYYSAWNNCSYAIYIHRISALEQCFPMDIITKIISNLNKNNFTMSIDH